MVVRRIKFIKRRVPMKKVFFPKGDAQRGTNIYAKDDQISRRFLFVRRSAISHFAFLIPNSSFSPRNYTNFPFSTHVWPTSTFASSVSPTLTPS